MNAAADVVATMYASPAHRQWQPSVVMPWWMGRWTMREWPRFWPLRVNCPEAVDAGDYIYCHKDEKIYIVYISRYKS